MVTRPCGIYQGMWGVQHLSGVCVWGKNINGFTTKETTSSWSGKPHLHYFQHTIYICNDKTPTPKGGGGGLGNITEREGWRPFGGLKKFWEWKILARTFLNLIKKQNPGLPFLWQKRDPFWLRSGHLDSFVFSFSLTGLFFGGGGLKIWPQ